MTEVPQDFADILRGMRDTEDPRLNTTLAHAHRNGWSLQDLGDVFGVSFQAIQQRVRRCADYLTSELPHIPLPPRPPTRLPEPPRRQRLRVRPEIAQRLREMQQRAAKVNGATPPDHPDRAVAAEYTLMLHRLIQQGVSAYHLASVVGVSVDAIQFRLGRHGYRPLPPSQRTKYGTRDANQQGALLRR